MGHGRFDADPGLFQARQQAANYRCYRTSSDVFCHLGIISTIGLQRVSAVIGRIPPHLVDNCRIPGKGWVAPPAPAKAEKAGRGVVLSPPGKSSPLHPHLPNLSIIAPGHA